MSNLNLVIDCGNTFIKAAVFESGGLQEKFVFAGSEELREFLSSHHFRNALVSSVSIPAEEVLKWTNAQKKFRLDSSLPLPIANCYKTPQTLGVDRIAAVCGAIEIFPDRDCLVIDAGTAITYDFIDRKKNYLGGAISPGISMRFRALHTFTERLPLIAQTDDFSLIGNSTETCIQSGVLNGVLQEMDGCIQQYKTLYPDLGVVLTGGDTLFFENKLKQPIFAARDLVLSGLNRILQHHAAN